jgi:uncharacterized tellurite resistance protein B-like protein
MVQEILEQGPLEHESKIRNDAAYQASAVYVIQLAVIAALIDGQASEIEMKNLVELVSERFRMPPEEVSRLANEMLVIFQKHDIGKNPTNALRFATKALENMIGLHRKLAFDISEQVIIRGGIDEMEKGFLAQLKNFVKA